MPLDHPQFVAYLGDNALNQLHVSLLGDLGIVISAAS